MKLKLYSKGAAQEVTGSRHYLEIGNKTLQIDCGAFQGKRKESEEKNRAVAADIKNVDAVILTHAHFDHCGMLPLLPKNGYRKNIYATPATRDLASLIMMDRNLVSVITDFRCVHITLLPCLNRTVTSP